MNVIIRNIPNAVTCCNVAAGVLSIICASRGQELMWGLPAYAWAWIFIGIAAVADFMDGFCARALRAYSDLGKELDSLCDLVSFGVAPAILMFNCLEQSYEPWTAWLVPVIPVAGALRLAKFNIDTRQTTSFIGLPIPANAIFWIGYSALIYQIGAEFAQQWWCSVPVILFVSWLMLSPLPLFSLKFKTWGLRGNGWRWLLVATAVVLPALMGVPGLMWLVVAYVGYGCVAARH